MLFISFMTFMPRLGIDLGGTKIAGIVLAEDGRVLWDARVATPREDYAGTIEAIADLVAAGEQAAGGRCTVGLGIPGAISPATGLVKNANSTWLNGRPFQQDLERRLARSVRLANDANCLAVSEASDGAAAGARVVFGVILGTGCGGGVVVGQDVITGANAIAGEWGHNPLPWPEDDERPGPKCYCGQHGCLEVFLSGPGIAADYARRGGGPCRSEEIVARADRGEALAATALDVWERRLARALATIINVLDPDVIVVGGGLSRLERVYKNVPSQWGAWVFSDRVVTKLVPAKHGDASGVRGAARLW
ncbi:MAG TPA: ROK family protein [Vicinamibacterales bacterium]|nr:ROK family protein [Vicinamibacterales bacterium]